MGKARKDLSKLTAPNIHKTGPRRRRMITDLDATADQIGPITHGCEIFGLSKGQFSISDVIEHILNQIGPADCVISTWTASGAAIDRAFALFESGKIRKCRIMVDPSFLKRQPDFCRTLTANFGVNAIRTFANHCKFIVLYNDKFNIVIRTSMNLNSNPRLENFEISEDKVLADFFKKFVDEVYEKLPPANFSQIEQGGLSSIGVNKTKITETDILKSLGK